MSRAGSLYRLQEIDLALDMRRTRLAEVQAALRDTAEVARATQVVQQAETALAQARTTARMAELEVQSVTEKLTHVESTLYGGTVRNPKELQDLQAEAASLKRRREGLEDRQFEALLGLETAEAVAQDAGKQLAAAQAEHSRRAGLLEQERRQITGDLERREVEREAAEVQVRPDDRETYDRLRRNRKGVAVARLIDGNCGACGVAPSAQRIASALAGEALVLCGNCERILYVDRAAHFSEEG